MQSFPDTTSPKPAPAEWDSAEPLQLERPNPGCSMSHVREWVRVSCRFGEALLTGVRVIAGPTEGVELTDRPLAPGQVPVNQWGGRVAHGVNLTFAVHCGDRRMFEVIVTQFEGRYAIGEDAAAVVSVLWLSGEPGPTIVID